MIELNDHEGDEYEIKSVTTSRLSTGKVHIKLTHQDGEFTELTMTPKEWTSLKKVVDAKCQSEDEEGPQTVFV